MRLTPAPRTVPRTTEMANPITARRIVMPTACQKATVLASANSWSKVARGPGRT